jgi:hypothetical protein
MALVFISCGQRNGEKELARKIQQMIESEFHLECYNADSVQGFDDVMSITEHLSKADYYLFIDFKRDGELPISVFTHQELALARAWGITEIIAFQEESLRRRYGMLEYVLAHPIMFTRDQLVDLVREEIRSKGWNNRYSRNLVISKLRAEDRLIGFTDHTGQSLDQVWFLHVCNHRNDRSAFDSVAVLYSVTNEVTGDQKSPDSSYLKWAGQKGFHKTIFPQGEAHFSAFSIRVNQPGVFLHSSADALPRQPIISDVGQYKLEYRVYSESFPFVKAIVSLNYAGPLEMVQEIKGPPTSADLVE